MLHAELEPGRITGVEDGQTRICAAHAEPPIIFAMAKSAALEAPRGQARLRRTRAVREGLEAYAFLAPALLLLIVFLLLPAFWVFGLSLFRWDLISSNPDYVGLANFDRLLGRDELFRKSVFQTVYFVAVTVPVSMALGLLMAVLLNAKMPGRDFMRTAIFTPYVMPLVATVIIWSFMFHPYAGVFNAVLNAFHLPKLNWLDNPRTVLPAIIFYSVWQHTGYNVVIFLAGLANIPPELQEAARVDGARAWSRFWRLTWPLLAPTTYFVLLVSIIGSFKVIVPILVFTGGVGGTGSGGGPDNAAETIGYYLYTQAFYSFHAGYAGAISVLLFLIILAVTFVQMGVLSRRVFYS
ncbi:MAG: sugar ABC transporter permease [Chloroflexi bacterium]|nr:MAG: sugar ABC transporter permease [Chloroflexota bacterium]TME15468.1 MAG: sugar ABC transporter permease [Chloroflexota bacterium]